MKNKKGIEPVIATVLLIVITIVVVALVIAFVVPFVQEQMTGAELCYGAIVKIEEAESCFNSTNVTVKVSRGAEKFDLSRLIIKFSTATDTKTVEITENLPAGPHEERTYFFIRGEVSNTAENLTSVAIAPVVRSGTTEKICEITSEIAIVCCPGEECTTEISPGT